MKTGSLQKKLLSGLVSMILVFGSVAASVSASKGMITEPVRVTDDETVYTVLTESGKVKNTVVIDWLRAEGKGKLRVEDIEPDGKVEPLKKTPKPEIREGKLIFAVDSEKFADLYYEIETRKELPLSFEIRYYLDNREISPTQLPGKSGHLKVTVKIKNRLKFEESIESVDAQGNESYETTEICTPLFVVANLNLDSSKFNNIKVENGFLSVQGSKYALSWFAFPQDEATISFEADAKDIEIPSMIISAMPRLPQEVSVNMIDQFKGLYKGLTGLEKLTGAHRMILSQLEENIDPSRLVALNQIPANMKNLAVGLNQTADGIKQISKLTDAQVMMLSEIINSIDPESFNSISTLKGGLEQVKSGVDQIVQLLQTYEVLLNQLEAYNQSAIEKAQQLEGSTSDTATLEDLKNVLYAERNIISTLKNGGEIQPGQTVPGLHDTISDLSSISDSLGSIIPQLDTMQSSLKQNFSVLKESLEVLKDGGQLQGNYLPGLTTVAFSLSQLSMALNNMEDGVSMAAEKTYALSELPTMFFQLKNAIRTVLDGGKMMGREVPGMNMTETGLKEMAEGINSGTEKMSFGKAYQDRLKELADEYDTFLGRVEKENYSGRVRFIFKVEAVEKKK